MTLIARSPKITATHLERKAVVYTLSRDCVGSSGNLPPHR
jgi:hypothetical protein